MSLIRRPIFVSLCALSLTACRTAEDRSAAIQPYAPGQEKAELPKILPQAVAPKEFPRIPASDAASADIVSGYQAEVVVRDLSYPTSVVFDNHGNMYAAEGGYSYGDPVAPARILRIGPTR